MECPKCHRNYAEDFSFCLEDGTRLVDPRALAQTAILATPEQSAPTEITPAPATVQTPAPATSFKPDPATTAPSSPHSWLIKTIVVVTGMIAVVLVWGLVKIGLWWLDKNQRTTNQPVASAPSTAPTASPGTDLQSLLERPSPSPSEPVASALGSKIGPGTYEAELTDLSGEFSKQGASVKLRLTFNADGTYFQQGFLSLPQAGLKDQLLMEEKGRYSQSDDKLILTNRLQRELLLGDAASWKVPDDGSESTEKLRSVSATGFQVYDNEQKQWFTFSRLGRAD